jgi:DNA polymerase III delta prime subunit
MKESFLKKYKCKKFSDFIIDKSYIDFLKTLISINDLNVIFVGNIGTGKTSLIDSLIKEYYQIPDIPKYNVLYINSLKEQGIQYYRNELKTFCQIKSNQSNKKKFVILDDIDNINEQSQQVFRNCIDKYSKNVNFIASCTNNQKVIESLQSRFIIIKLKPINREFLAKILEKIKKQENIITDIKTDKFILSICNNSIRLLISYLEKFYIIDKKIMLKDAKDICTNISFIDYEIYTKYWYNKDYENSINHIFKIFNKGYSVMDILDNYFLFIKLTDIIPDKIKFQVIKLICKYIAIFHIDHEYDIELSFFTNDLIKYIKNNEK